ncbi:MAG: rhomboid family intramembrane serine protease [Candidatus Aminicenantaceae bacterium]
MRELNRFDKKQHAEIFSDYLLVKGIENEVKDEKDGSFSLWVLDEEKLDDAHGMLEEFLNDPEKSKFRSSSNQAKQIRTEEKQANKRHQKMIEASKIQWSDVQSGRIGYVTLLSIIFCVGIFIISEFGRNHNVFQVFSITEYEISGNMIRWQPGLPEVFSGEIWRLISPILIHFGFIHILFNMLWLKSLGSEIENRISSVYLTSLILFIAVPSNLAQYLITGPSFGGMSGVVYGLLGFIWMKGKFDPESGFFLNKTILILMIGWFFISLTGLVGNVANIAHAVGLVCGMTWGYISAKIAEIRRK